MQCHQHAVKDFDLQLEMTALEMEMLKDNGEVLPYNEVRMDELEQKKLKLLVGKTFFTRTLPMLTGISWKRLLNKEPYNKNTTQRVLWLTTT